VSERFACRVTGQNRTTQRRPPTASTTDDPDAALRGWLRGGAKNHPRRGFRNAYNDARGEGWHVNHKKIQRLWREEGLRVLQKRQFARLPDTRGLRRRPCERQTAVGSLGHTSGRAPLAGCLVHARLRI
jgi:transposase InsO family protein